MVAGCLWLVAGKAFKVGIAFSVKKPYFNHAVRFVF
jgi:hypothetical protein